MVLYMYLQEVALDDYSKGYAKKLDKYGAWYIDKHGKFLRHAKILFKTHDLQKRLVKYYKQHDPTKIQDGCIEVLLGKIGDDYKAISTLRKLDAKCMLKHRDTYASVPKSVLQKAIKYTDGIPDDEKEKILNIVDMIKKSTLVKKKKEDKPVLIKSSKDIKKLK